MDVLDQMILNAAGEYRSAAIAIAAGEFVSPEKLSQVLQLSDRRISHFKSDVETLKVRSFAIAILADKSSDLKDIHAARRVLRLTGHPVDQQKIVELEQRKSLLTGKCEKLSAFIGGREFDDYTKRPIAVDTPQTVRERIGELKVRIQDWDERCGAAGIPNNKADRLRSELEALNERLGEVEAEHATARIKRDKAISQIEEIEREISEVPRPEDSTDFADHPFDGVSHRSKVAADNQARELDELRRSSMGNRGY